MKHIKQSLQMLTLASCLCMLTNCSQPAPDTQQPGVQLEQQSSIFIDVTAENRDAIYADAIQNFGKKNIDVAYQQFQSVAQNGLLSAHVYLGIIEAQPGKHFNPRSALSNHYLALADGAHSSSILLLARALKSGENITQDTVASAQYYARLINTIDDGTNIYQQEAHEFIASLDIVTKQQAAQRERAYLTRLNLPAKGKLGALAKAVSALENNFQAPGTAYLSLQDKADKP